MTFLEKYEQESRWLAKALVMEIFHLTMKTRNAAWTVMNTADYFRVSIGLVSENLRLADAFHRYPQLETFESRQKAVQWLTKTLKLKV